MIDFVMMPIPVNQFSAVCAFLGGSSATAVVAASPTGNVEPVKPATDRVSAGPETSAPENQASVGNGLTATTNASLSETPEGVDAHGHPWSAELHASTGSKTKEGLWRMKVGVTRPDPLAGFPIADAATGTAAPEAASSTANSATSTGDVDEFAAFRNAVAKNEATNEAAAASVPARVWTDADLGALCNQAAVKLGDPSPVKAVIADFIPEDQVAHSRNIPADQRADFAAAVEKAAGIEFAG